MQREKNSCLVVSALLFAVIAAAQSACAAQGNIVDTAAPGSNATCRGVPFGGTQQLQKQDSKAQTDEHAALSEGDLSPGDRGGIFRIGDFDVAGGRINYVFPEGDKIAENQAPPTQTERSGSFMLSRIEAEALVCAANNIWADSSSTLAVNPGRLSQLILQHENQKKELGGFGNFSGYAKTYADVFWSIVAKHSRSAKSD